MKLSGTIEKIIFQNAENGYTVCDVLCGKDTVTVVGTFPPVTEGEELELDGEMKKNSRYGDQFATTEVKTIQPESEAGIIKYLSSGLFKGVGPVTANALVKQFHKDTLKIIEHTPGRLTEANGVSRKKAQAMHESFVAVRELQKTVMYLQKFEISTGLAIKIYKCYGEETRKILESNPYKMVEDIEGIGFVTADKIAARMGIASDSDFRIRAGTTYVLREQTVKEGHTYLPRGITISETIKILNLASEHEYRVGQAIDELMLSDAVKQFTLSDKELLIAESRFFYTEKSIAAKLIKLNNEFNTIHLALDTEIADFEKQAGLRLHDTQKAAIRNSVSGGTAVITGGPGTGKTTIIKCIVKIMKARGLKISLCAPTGRAAKRLSEATGEEAKTVHRLLELDFSGGKGVFNFNENTTLPADVIIVDEISMADIFIFNALIRAVKRGGRLIIVGDRDQLPSVGAGNVLSDIIASGQIPVSELTHIYRQGLESLIVTNAHRINRGEMPEINNSETSDFFFIEREEQEDIIATAKEMILKRIPQRFKIVPREIQVLAALKKGIAGVNNFNIELQGLINPSTPDKKSLLYGDTCFRKGDKVMQIANDYQLEWKRFSEDGGVENGTGVYNGDIGIIEEIDTAASEVTVLFDDGRYCEYKIENMDSLVLAYAISVHKSQGCEFDVVIIALQGGSPLIMTRNLIYTALTRAKKMAVIIGGKMHLRRMINNNKTAQRYTALCDFMLSESKNYKEMFG